MDSGKYTCVDCIWSDQCENAEICDFFDRGELENELPSDHEIQKIIESNRNNYFNEYFVYTKEL